MTRDLSLLQNPLFQKGIDEFNAQEFFACHESLEEFWREQTGAERELTQGIIQIAVAYYHLKRGNVKGALRLFDRALPRVRAFAPVSMGLALTDFIGSVEAHRTKLAAGELLCLGSGQFPVLSRCSDPQVGGC
jgi:uncharacterized protein